MRGLTTTIREQRQLLPQQLPPHRPHNNATIPHKQLHAQRRAECDDTKSQRRCIIQLGMTTSLVLSEDKCKQEGGQRFLKKQIKEPEPPSAFFTLDIGVATGA